MSDTVIETATPAAGSVAGTASWRDYLQLLKPRVMTLVVFTGIAGLVAAPGALHPVLAFAAILAIAVGAGAAGAINMWYDRDIDAVMARTAARPLPQGRMEAADALGFGVVLSGGSVMLMGLAVNWTAAALLLAAILTYVFVYTIWLKRRTPQNIVIGGAAGAFPPMIGWAAVTGDVSAASVALFALIFLWTPPHFWALALVSSEDYSRAGVPMLPVVAGPAETKRQILLYTLLLLPAGAAPWYLGAAGTLYGVGTLLLGLLFATCALRLWRAHGQASNRAAWLTFGYSIFYLFAVFALLIADHAGVAGGTW